MVSLAPPRQSATEVGRKRARRREAIVSSPNVYTELSPSKPGVRGPPEGGPLSQAACHYRAMLPRSILQMPCECVAAYRTRLQAPRPVHVGAREYGWIARCLTP